MPDDTPRNRDLEIAPPEGVGATDYQLIEEAVMDTARGRWFLREYARRIRAAETRDLLAALARIERSIADSASAADPADLQPREEPDLSLPHPDRASINVSSDVELATNSGGVAQLQSVQEKLLDIVWHMRERGFDGLLCTAIRREAGKLAGIIEQSSTPQDKTAGNESDQPAPVVADKAAVTDDGVVGQKQVKESPAREIFPSDQSSETPIQTNATSGTMRSHMARLEIAAEQVVLDAGDDRPAALTKPETSACAKPSGIVDESLLADIDRLCEREKLALFS